MTEEPATPKLRQLRRHGETLELIVIDLETKEKQQKQEKEKKKNPPSKDKKEKVTHVETPQPQPDKTRRELASNLPMKTEERGARKPVTESGTAVVARSLAPQLGSDPSHLHNLQIDERKVAVLNPYTQTAYGYFQQRGEIDEVRFWDNFVKWELVTSQAINGLARQHILKAIAAASGAQVTDIMRRPNVLARNVWRRDWQQQADREGKQVLD